MGNVEAKVPEGVQQVLQELLVFKFERPVEEQTEIDIGIWMKFTAPQPTSGQNCQALAIVGSCMTGVSVCQVDDPLHQLSD
jgi:hypothetical protein